MTHVYPDVDLKDLRDFHTRVKNHDWYHQMSDSHAVWVRGKADMDKLAEEAKNDYYKHRILKYWTARYYRGWFFSIKDGIRGPEPVEPWRQDNCLWCCSTGLNIDATHKDHTYTACPYCEGQGLLSVEWDSDKKRYVLRTEN